MSAPVPRPALPAPTTTRRWTGPSSQQAAATALIAAVVLLVAGCQQTSDPARLERIAAVLARGDSAGAIAQLQSYVASYPEDDIAWSILGNAHLRADQDEQAEVAYQQALQVNPGCVQALTGKGVLYRKQGDYDQAMQAYRSALAADPSYAHAYSSMSVIAILQDKTAEAVDFAEKAYDLDRTDATIAANLAIAYHRAGKTAQRDKTYNAARQLGYAKLDSLDRIFAKDPATSASPTD